LIFGLFIATAFSITALPVLGRILIEFKLTRTAIGVIAISAAAINDVTGWLMLAVVTALAAANFSVAGFVQTLAILAIYVLVCWFIVRPVLKRCIRMDARVSGDQSPSGSLLALVLSVLFLSALATYKIGIFAIFGGFMLGLLVNDERVFVASWNDKIGKLVQVLFVPIFFTYTGLRTNLGSLDSAQTWGWCALLIALSTLGKFGSAYLAARMSGMGSAASKILGLLMNARGLMELIVINVGYDLGVISQQMFTMLVLMALLSNVIVTPGLKRWLPNLKAEYGRSAETTASPLAVASQS
ncbi:MAG TPA: cation:proton antiporter, partial [Rhodocyclaceae bacterium]|nr:cation:proton antiporter [Rhodocyclaceae bacterium]